MRLLLHTIAIEPARWTPERVSRPLAQLLPAIAAAGFTDLEIFEPHLALAPDESSLPDLLVREGLAPVVLSSYLELSVAASDERFEAQASELLARVDRFNFRKVRLFPGGPPPAGEVETTMRVLSGRLRSLALSRPEVEWLLETHDGGLADDSTAMVSLVESCGRPNIGLLWQPVIFEERAARAQLAIQKDFVRHVHLQNRQPDLSFASVADGVVPWAELLATLNFSVDATLEFVPAGMRPLPDFDLSASLRQAAAELQYVAGLRDAAAARLRFPGEPPRRSSS